MQHLHASKCRTVIPRSAVMWSLLASWLRDIIKLEVIGLLTKKKKSPWHIETTQNPQLEMCVNTQNGGVDKSASLGCTSLSLFTSCDLWSYIMFKCRRRTSGMHLCNSRDGEIMFFPCRVRKDIISEELCCAGRSWIHILQTARLCNWGNQTLIWLTH